MCPLTCALPRRSFWNFDALFQPQQHPARDAHDTFFLTKPASTTKFPEDYLQRVRVGAVSTVWVLCCAVLCCTAVRRGLLCCAVVVLPLAFCRSCGDSATYIAII